jgi:hypothetical protein
MNRRRKSHGISNISSNRLLFLYNLLNALPNGWNGMRLSISPSLFRLVVLLLLFLLLLLLLQG